MRLLVPLTLLLAACSQESPDTATYSAGGSDRLCIRNAGGSLAAGVIVYAKDRNTNCSIAGQFLFVDRKQPVIQARGDGCEIEVSGDPKSELRLGKLSPQCAYYCGPGASLDGKLFRRLPTVETVVDLAGDPLC